MASIAQRGRRFSIRFRYEGQNLRVTVGGNRAKAESVRLIVESTLDDLRLGRLTIPAGMAPADFIASGGKSVPKRPALTFAEAADLWAGSRVAADTTRDGEAKHLRHLRGVFGKSDLNRLDLQGYVDRRLKAVSPRTVRKEFVTLKALLKTLRSQGYSAPVVDTDRLNIPADPPRSRFAALAKASDGRRTLLSSAEVQELRAVVRERGSELIADAVDFVALTGARRSEVCRVHAGDVDLDSDMVTITEKKRRHGHTTHRVIPIHPDLRPVLKRRVETRTGVVFTPSIDTLSQGLANALKGTRFDLKGLGFHSLRHSAASRLIAANVPITAVADVLGHADSRTTLGIYAHAFADDSRRAVSLL